MELGADAILWTMYGYTQKKEKNKRAKSFLGMTLSRSKKLDAACSFYLS